MTLKRLLNGSKNSNCNISPINTRSCFNCNLNRFPKIVSPMQFFVDSCNRSHTLPRTFTQQITKKN
jgi:hypothetical protein